jgi:hypothetical protein
MVKGLDVFRERFRDFADRYILIGGTACDLVMREAGVQFRATKDLDILLCVEALDKAFGEAFWAFVREGGYQIQQRAEGKRQFYRFQKPAAENYPFMLELFSRAPDVLPIAPGSHLTPVPLDEEVSSLSAILMDEGYYGFIHAGRRDVEGLPTVGPERLIALKARAWLDLTERKNKGEAIDSKAIRKHKNDVFRLYQSVDPELLLEVPDMVSHDMGLFTAGMASEGVDLEALGVTGASLDSVLAALRELYRVG